MKILYQLKGDLVLQVCDNGNFYDVPIAPATSSCRHVTHCRSGRRRFCRSS